MSFGLLLDLQRQVKLGGRAVRLGPLRFQFGGRWYTVGRIPLLRWLQVLYALDKAGLPPSSLLDSPLLVPAAMARLFVREPMPEAHARRISPAQMATVLTLVRATNDLPYLVRVCDERASGDDSDDFDLFDEIDVLASLRPQYDHESLCRLPAQVYYRIWDSIKNRMEHEQGTEHGRRIVAPVFDHPPTAEELNAALSGVTHG